MPAIDWTSQGFVFLLAAAGAVLILLGVLFYFLPAARIKGLALLVGIGGGVAAGTALGLYLVRSAPPAAPDKPSGSPVTEPSPAAARMTWQALERFQKATPAERMTHVNRLPNAAAAWHKVERGDVSAVIERGILESADNAEVVVQVHARKPGAPAATIRKVLVEDGQVVRKDQLLVELDDTAFEQQVTTQKALIEQRKIELAQLQQQAELDTERANLDLEEAQHQFALAERDQRTAPSSDAERKKGLELKVKEARQLVKTRTFQTGTTKTRTEAARRAAQASLDTETTLLKELESDLANCKIKAPREGHVVYRLPELMTGRPTLAAGQPVQQGQHLMYIPDLAKMQVRTLIHEARIPFVRSGQTAQVRVDAFPDQTLTGKVESIAQHGENQLDERVYPVTIPVANEKLRLKPGMSAEVRIQVQPRRNVLRVPAQALVVVNRQRVCFVKSGEEIDERPVATGLGDDGFIEIVRGVAEGEQVLRDPRAVVRQVLSVR
jgi:RND family efflux transporter MFP subunit